MHISLTPVLESKIKAKVASGFYNNASEVIREALRFMEQNEMILHELKRENLRQAVTKGAKQAEAGIFSERSIQDILQSCNESVAS